ncbi:hypothetical protein TTHERM_00919660 (macronuclear) [Tetrahymena thermophila SB210]|uniref:Uncharacterized protein n=1 Tax=Tetrahymena thermophila (strain SB210) TaxID=312017 RepID=Q24IK8_TETTS|nr:hypothetical protein TTHERM_00919660 [Tetrahymena thermophila SB210]EAS07617.1 hypothetical protein TTHERM_00919660 [Tetrahymena thermophila SB210]|eukprot:XP_001027859.1 hypothetical protein TTHERM_00919660 [Tetrahymena thermophila SB210]
MSIPSLMEINMLQHSQFSPATDLLAKSLQNIQASSQLQNNILLQQQDSSTQSSSSSLQQSFLGQNSFLQQAINNISTQPLAQTSQQQFQIQQALQPQFNPYLQNLSLNDIQLLKNSLQQSQQVQQNNLYNLNKNQNLTFNPLLKKEDNGLSFGQNQLFQIQDLNTDQMNQQLLQSQLIQLKNKQLLENTQLPLMHLLQQQQQQQQQQIQQQQQQQQQNQQMYNMLYAQQLLAQQQIHQQQILNPRNTIEQNEILFRNNRILSNQGLQSDQVSSEMRFFNKKQEACIQDKAICFESPNLSCTTLPAARNSFSNISQSTSSSQINLALYPQTSPLIQNIKSEQGTQYPQLNFLVLQQLQQQQLSSYPQIQQNQLQFNKLGQQKIDFPSYNEESRNSKQKKKSNPKRNTIKNLGNQIISFMCNKKSIKIIQKIPQIEFEEKEFDEFKKFCEQYKNKMLKIADLRNIWISNKQNVDDKTSKYHKIIRVLSRFYLNNEAIPKLLTSNKLKDRKIHLSIRRILVEKLKDPESFTTLNQYSKK